MEFLLLAVLGLATLGAKEVLNPEAKEDTEKDGKDDKGNKGKDAKAKDGKDGKDGKDKDGDKKEEPKKTPEQELMEAIAKYESQSHTGKKIKFHYEIEDK